MTLKEYAKQNKLTIRDAYRLVEQGKLKVQKQLMEIQSVRKMWVLVVVDK